MTWKEEIKKSATVDDFVNSCMQLVDKELKKYTKLSLEDHDSEEELKDALRQVFNSLAFTSYRD